MFNWNKKDNKMELINEIKDLIARVENSVEEPKAEIEEEPKEELKEEPQEEVQEEEQETVENSITETQLEDTLYEALAEVLIEE